MQQVAGLSQLAAEFMQVDPLVIDLGWGELKSALVKLPDAAFVTAGNAASQRQALLGQYVDAFRHVEASNRDKARAALQNLSTMIKSEITPGQQPRAVSLVDAQRAKLA